MLLDLAEATLSGAAYGLAAVVVSQPFDTVKTKQQASAAFAHRGLIHTATATLREGGPAAMYSGFAAAAAGSMMFRAVPFAAYSFTSARLRESSEWWERHPVVLAAVAGASGGLLRSLLECPLEVAKVRRQVGTPWQMSAAYQGLPITAARNVSASRPSRSAPRHRSCSWRGRAHIHAPTAASPSCVNCVCLSVACFARAR